MKVMNVSLPTTIVEVEKVYDLISDLHNKNLKQKGIKLPSLTDSKGNLRHGALQIVYLFCNMKKVVHKDEVQKWVRENFISNVGDTQIRHLGSQQGFNFYKGGEKLPNGVIVGNGKRDGTGVLWDLENVAPHWKNHRRNVVVNGSWEEIKKAYDYCCVTCGSKEGSPNFKNKSAITKLQKGHMNAEKGSDMSTGNLIPQCLECNQSYRDKVNFDAMGIVVSLASTELVRKSSKEIRRKILEELLRDPEINVNTLLT